MPVLSKTSLPKPSLSTYGLSTKLGDLADAGKKALIVYIVAGDPAPDVTVTMMHQLVAAGADIIELGVPFSDPEAEGPVIQLAHERALAHGVSLKDCLGMVAAFREDDRVTPVILMGYLNPVEVMGYEAFGHQAAEAGVSGTIIVNLPPEEAADIAPLLEHHGIDNVCLLAPTTTDERAGMICAASRGFVYYVSLKGTTGASTLDVGDVAEKVSRFRAMSPLPVMVGFGITDGASARAVTGVADGAVVGTAIVRIIAEHELTADKQLPGEKVSAFVRELRTAIDR